MSRNPLQWLILLVLAVTLPLIYAAAWLGEVIDDRRSVSALRPARVAERLPPPPAARR